MELTVFSLFFFFFTFHLPSCFSGTSLISFSDLRFLHNFNCHFSLFAFPFRRTIELHGISAWSSEHYVRFHRRLSLRAPDESLWHHRLFKWVSNLSHSLSLSNFFWIFFQSLRSAPPHLPLNYTYFLKKISYGWDHSILPPLRVTDHIQGSKKLSYGTQSTLSHARSCLI